MKLSDLFTKKPVAAHPEETLASIARRMAEHRVGAVVVVEEGRPVGIVTDRDLALALGARGVSPQAQAREVMTRHIVAIPDEADVQTATKFLRDCAVRRLPIVDDQDRLVGIVTLDDLLSRLGLELCNLVEGIKTEMEVK